MQFYINLTKLKSVFRTKGVLTYKYGNVTFNNFLLYVLSTIKTPNEHWIPYYKTCSYCNFGYDQFIGRLENFERDMKYVIRRNNLTNIIPILKRFNPTPKYPYQSDDIQFNDIGEIMSNQRTQQYFQKLDTALIQKIYTYFKPDFQLFKYSIKEFH